MNLDYSWLPDEGVYLTTERQCLNEYVGILLYKWLLVSNCTIYKGLPVMFKPFAGIT